MPNKLASITSALNLFNQSDDMFFKSIQFFISMILTAGALGFNGWRIGSGEDNFHGVEGITTKPWC